MVIALSVFATGSQAWADDEGETESYSAQESNENAPTEDVAKNDDADRFDDEGNPISNGENDQTASLQCRNPKNREACEAAGMGLTG
jgi:hypothetical protein